MSNYLNDHVTEDETLLLGPPAGETTLDTGDGPVLLVSAGIGITPMAAMLDHLARTQPTRLLEGRLRAHSDRRGQPNGRVVLLAVLMRPAGGWLSDRIGPVRVLAGVFAVIAVAAAITAFTPALMPVGTITFLSMAAALGAGSGAVFALVALLAPGNKVGSVTGIVGAAGGLGGFVPPLVMGALYGALGSYALGLAALAAVAAAALVFIATSVHRAITCREAELAAQGV